MKNTPLFFLLLILLCSKIQSSNAQNYHQYHALVNEAEKQFLLKDDSKKAFKLYDEAFKKFKRPFLKDVYVAAQIAYYKGDTTQFLSYIKKCYDLGMTIQCLHKAPIFAIIFDNTNLVRVLNNSYNKRKVITIDTAIRDSVFLKFHLMELAKDEMGKDTDLIQKFKQMDILNTIYYSSFLKKGVFPSEQLIGIETDSIFNYLLQKYKLKPRLSVQEKLSNSNIKFGKPLPNDYELWNSMAYISYLHYPCSFQRDKNLLIKAIETGFVHPKDIALMEEWQALDQNNDFSVHDCTFTPKPYYYNLKSDLTKTDSASLIGVEENRKRLNMQEYSVDVIKKKMEREKGFVFFFGFHHHR